MNYSKFLRDLEKVLPCLFRAEPNSRIREVIFDDVKTDMPSTLRLVEPITTEILENLINR